jgi:hypothetical protein
LYAEIANVKEPFNRDDVWRLFAVWATLKGIRLPDWKYFENTPTRKIKGRFDELSKVRKYRESIPDWIDELGIEELGEDVWSKEISVQNKQADVILRTNTLRTTKKELQKSLGEENIETETRWNRFETAPKRHGNKSNTQKSRSKSFLFNFFSIFRTVTYDRYIPIQTLIFTLLRNVTALKELGIPVVCPG